MCVRVRSHTYGADLADRRGGACWHGRRLALRRTGSLAFICWLRQKRALQTAWNPIIKQKEGKKRKKTA